jgi:hypothetical protein
VDEVSTFLEEVFCFIAPAALEGAGDADFSLFSVILAALDPPRLKRREPLPLVASLGGGFTAGAAGSSSPPPSCTPRTCAEGAGAIILGEVLGLAAGPVSCFPSHVASAAAAASVPSSSGAAVAVCWGVPPFEGGASTAGGSTVSATTAAEADAPESPGAEGGEVARFPPWHSHATEDLGLRARKRAEPVETAAPGIRIDMGWLSAARGVTEGYIVGSGEGADAASPRAASFSRVRTSSGGSSWLHKRAL